MERKSTPFKTRGTFFRGSDYSNERSRGRGYSNNSNRNNNNSKSNSNDNKKPVHSGPTLYSFLNKFGIGSHTNARKVVHLILAEAHSHEAVKLLAENTKSLDEILGAEYGISVTLRGPTFSFQQVWVPFCQFLYEADKSVIYFNQLRGIFQRIYYHSSFFWDFGVSLVQKILSKNKINLSGIIDPSEGYPLIDIESIGDIIYPVIGLIEMFLKYITDAAVNPQLLETLLLITQFMTKPPETIPKKQQQLLIKMILNANKKCNLIHHMPEKVKKAPRPRKRQALVYPPGELNQTGQSRHDNDHVDFHQIEIVPTYQEIMSDEHPYLPTEDYDSSSFIEKEVDQYLDVQFRLLREEAYSLHKKAIRYFITERNHFNLRECTIRYLGNGKAGSQKFSMFVFRNVTFYGLADGRDGVACHISFDQPAPKGQQREFWTTGCKALQHGCFVSVIIGLQNGTPNVVSGTVVRNDREKEQMEIQFFNENRCHITILLMKPTQLAFLAKMKGECFLLEVKGQFLQTNNLILKSIQGMSSDTDHEIPFEQLLISPEVEVDEEPPAYLVDKLCNFESIMKPEYKRRAGTCEITNFASVRAYLSTQQEFMSLDDSQMNAFAAALTKKVALIQGPPGTGKSYVGVRLVKFLIDNFSLPQQRIPFRLPGVRIPLRTASSPLPILCVCYTNHALDQFLMELIKAGVPKSAIARLGGRSKEQSLEGCFVNSFPFSTFTKREYFLYRQEKEQEMHALEDYLGNLTKTPSDQDLLEWLQIYDEDSYYHLTHMYGYDDADDDDGQGAFQTSNKKSLIHSWRTNKKLRIPQNPLWSLTIAQRRNQYHQWVEMCQQSSFDNVQQLAQSIATLVEKHQKTDTINSIEYLRNKTIIGMTTSGCAKHYQMLKSLGAKIVICEEAGEVLESHVLAAISKQTQHLILIGDHQQLRPKIEEYSLRSEANMGYSLDVSLFERLVDKFSSVEGIDLQKTGTLATLHTQRRMRPSISDLIRKTLYPGLHDHESVKRYPELKGFEKSLWWFNHNSKENESAGSGSYTNQFEVNAVVPLLRYLIRQGYTENEDIVVLTPYLGQLMALRKRLSSEKMQVELSDRDLEDIAKSDYGFDDEDEESDNKKVTVMKSEALGRMIRVSTVDNFQGEEAKVVILSMVRSNDDGTIGFLKTSNRVNVMLSRAKHGMIIIGSADTIQKKHSTSMLSNCIKQMKEGSNYGDYIGFKCQNHSAVNRVSTIQQLNSIAVDGGCEELCAARLDCGHACTRACHPDDRSHMFAQCTQACPRLCERGHPCRLLCYEECRCPVKLPKELSCGHVANVPCHAFNSETECMVPIKVKLSTCSHEHAIPCHLLRKYKATRNAALVKKYVNCQKICGIVLDCGHACTLTCHTCKTHSSHPEARNIAKCTQVVPHEGVLVCGHPCSGLCGHKKIDECPPCTRKCETACAHSKCRSTCNTSCAICAEPCTWACPHGACTMFCGSPCDRLPCDKRCTKLLSCGHQCTSICGEKCPDPKYGCKECVHPDFKDRQICVILGTTVGCEDWDPDSKPIIQLPCTHVLNLESLDGIFEMSKFYVSDTTTGEWTGTLTPLPQQIAEMKILPLCPYCNQRIQGISRYGRPTNFLAESRNKRVLFSEVTHLCRTWQEVRQNASQADTIQNAIDQASREYKRLADKDPTKIIHERSEQKRRIQNPEASDYIAKKYVQPYTMILTEIVQLYLLEFTKFKVEKSRLNNSIRYCMDLGKLSVSDNLRSSYEMFQRMITSLVRMCSAEDKQKYIVELREFEDPKIIKLIEEDDDDIKMVVEVMKREVGAGGHWYECPNGHVYTIGECGGAMQMSKCTECGATIGGQSHISAAGNRPAHEFLAKIDSMKTTI